MNTCVCFRVLCWSHSRRTRAMALWTRASWRMPWSHHGVLRRAGDVKRARGRRGWAQPRDGPDVVQLADMARIRVSDEEVRAWQPQIARVVEWFQKMEGVDVSGVEPLVHAGEDAERWRRDVPEPFVDVDGILAMAADKQGTYVRVPRMYDGDVE